MKHKTKIILSVIIVFILTGVIAGYYFEQKRKIIKEEQKDQQSEELIDDSGLLGANDVKIKESFREQPTAMTSTKVLTGKIISMDSNLISIKTENGSESLNIQDGTLFYSVKNSEFLSKNISDVEVGMEAMVEFDEKTKSAVVIRINQ